MIYLRTNCYIYKMLHHFSDFYCFFNDGDTELTLRINWDHFYIFSGNYQVHDIWQNSDLGITKELMNFTLGSHDVILLRLIKSP